MEIQSELDKTYNELRKIQNQISELRYQEFTINSEYIELLKEKCKENIGRCFKKINGDEVIAYCKIIDIDKTTYPVSGNIMFNPYQYPALWFSYPYKIKNNRIPFYENTIFSGSWEGDDILCRIQGISYKEINAEEFQEKFNEVNFAWSEKITKKMLNGTN